MHSLPALWAVGASKFLALAHVLYGFRVSLNNLRDCVICHQYIEYNWTYLW